MKKLFRKLIAALFLSGLVAVFPLQAVAEVVASGFLNTGTGAQTIDLTLAQTGDVLVVATGYPSGANPGAGGPTDDTGWTEQTDPQDRPTHGAASVFTVWSKEYTSAPPASETFDNIVDGATPRDIAVAYALLRGVDASAIDFPAPITMTATQTSVPHPSTTVPGAGTGHVVLFEFQPLTATNVVAPTNFTIGEVSPTMDGTAWNGYVIHRDDQPAGATGTLSVSFDSLSTIRIGFTISLANDDGGGEPVVATKLIYGSQPGNVVVGQTFGAFTVRAVDEADALDDTFTGNVSLTLQVGNGTLGGTTTKAAVGGIATFDDISIDTLNTDAVIRASASGLTAVDSDQFDVTAGGSGGAAGVPSTSRIGGMLQ